MVHFFLTFPIGISKLWGAQVGRTDVATTSCTKQMEEVKSKKQRSKRTQRTGEKAPVKEEEKEDEERQALYSTSDTFTPPQTGEPPGESL